MSISAVVCAVWTGVSSAFVAGAAAENVHSFAFAIYVGGTVLGLLLFIAALEGDTPVRSADSPKILGGADSHQDL